MSSGDGKNYGVNEKVNPGGAFASLAPVETNSTAAVGQATEPAPGGPKLWLGLKPAELTVMSVVSVMVLTASYCGWSSIGVAEAWGFVTGGICVWLVVREHLWNWPIGLANN